MSKQVKDQTTVAQQVEMIADSWCTYYGMYIP